jgi:hypothetical protein
MQIELIDTKTGRVYGELDVRTRELFRQKNRDVKAATNERFKYRQKPEDRN